MFERPQSGERAILVHVEFPGESEPEDLLEFSDLAVSAGASPVATVTASRNAPDARYFVGSGKADEIRRNGQRPTANITTNTTISTNSTTAAIFHADLGKWA